METLRLFVSGALRPYPRMAGQGPTKVLGSGLAGAQQRGDTIHMATAAPATENRPPRSKRIRKIFGNIHEVSEMPNLIEVQRESYEQFLRSRPQDGYVSGLEKTLRSVFPIRDSPAPPSSTSSITSSKSRNTTPTSAASAA